MHALGFWTGTVAIENQLVKCTSGNLGEHIRARRKALNLKQSDVAGVLGVCEDTITGWENGRSKPQICHYPVITGFLGYNPILVDDITLGGRIKQYRVEKGITQEELAQLIKVNESTIGSWESNKHNPRPKTLNVLRQFGILQLSY